MAAPVYLLNEITHSSTSFHLFCSMREGILKAPLMLPADRGGYRIWSEVGALSVKFLAPPARLMSESEHGRLPPRLFDGDGENTPPPPVSAEGFQLNICQNELL